MNQSSTRFPQLNGLISFHRANEIGLETYVTIIRSAAAASERRVTLMSYNLGSDKNGANGSPKNTQKAGCRAKPLDGAVVDFLKHDAKAAALAAPQPSLLPDEPERGASRFAGSPFGRDQRQRFTERFNDDRHDLNGRTQKP